MRPKGTVKELQRRRKRAITLLRHDWVYRWKAILDFAGLEPEPALAVREKRLKELAEMAQKTWPGKVQT